MTNPSNRTDVTDAMIDEAILRTVSLLLASEEAALLLVPDNEPGALDLQQNRVAEMKHLLGRLTVRKHSRVSLTAQSGDRLTPEWCLRMAEIEGDAEIGAGSPDHPLRCPPMLTAQQQSGEVENMRDVGECEVPPRGWICTRAPGHEGPCAAIAESSPEGTLWLAERALRTARHAILRQCDTFRAETLITRALWHIKHEIAALRSAQPVDQEEVRELVQRLREATRDEWKLHMPNGALHLHCDIREAATLLEKLGPKQ